MSLCNRNADMEMQSLTPPSFVMLHMAHGAKTITSLAQMYGLTLKAFSKDGRLLVIVL